VERDVIARVAAPSSLLSGLTYTRILAVPAVMGLILLGPDRKSAYTAASVVFAVAAVTDFADGYLARRWAVTTKLGSFLDTTADKLLVTGVLIALVDVDRASPWIAAIIIGRELLILGLRGLVAAEGTVFPPSIWGKLKTNVQFVAIFLAILHLGHPVGPLRVDEWVMIVAAAITVVSAVEYLARFSSTLSGDAS
jgi:CDP-diacylglycerol---glycerol-3-phosphate 3-phosphatidyltransferase